MASQPAIGAVVSEDANYTSARDIPPFVTVRDTVFYPTYPLFIQFMERRSGASASSSISDVVGKISPRPVLFISNGQTYDYWQAEYYFNLADHRKEHWNLPESIHCTGMAARPEEYEQRIIEFFETSMNITSE